MFVHMDQLLLLLTGNHPRPICHHKQGLVLRQEDYCEFWAPLGCRVRLCLKKINKNLSWLFVGLPFKNRHASVRGWTCELKWQVVNHQILMATYKPQNRNRK